MYQMNEKLPDHDEQPEDEVSSQSEKFWRPSLLGPPPMVSFLSHFLSVVFTSYNRVESPFTNLATSPTPLSVAPTHLSTQNSPSRRALSQTARSLWTSLILLPVSPRRQTACRARAHLQNRPSIRARLQARPVARRHPSRACMRHRLRPLVPALFRVIGRLSRSMLLLRSMRISRVSFRG